MGVEETYTRYLNVLAVGMKLMSVNKACALDTVMVDEVEILEFYHGGASITELSYSYDRHPYLLKKCLANEPEFAAKGYIYRPLSKK